MESTRKPHSAVMALVYMIMEATCGGVDETPHIAFRKSEGRKVENVAGLDDRGRNWSINITFVRSRRRRP